MRPAKVPNPYSFPFCARLWATRAASRWSRHRLLSAICPGVGWRFHALAASCHERFIECGDPHPSATWAKLIRKVCEADPLTCPECQGKMRLTALIDDPHVVRRILEHLARWAPLPPQRGPPAQHPDWPPGATIPLTYHRVPDIA